MDASTILLHFHKTLNINEQIEISFTYDDKQTELSTETWLWLFNTAAHSSLSCLFFKQGLLQGSESAGKSSSLWLQTFKQPAGIQAAALISGRDISIQLWWCLHSLEWLRTGWRCCVDEQMRSPRSHMKGSNPEHLFYAVWGVRSEDGKQ